MAIASRAGEAESVKITPRRYFTMWRATARAVRNCGLLASHFSDMALNCRFIERLDGCRLGDTADGYNRLHRSAIESASQEDPGVFAGSHTAEEAGAT
jgi:hypothetical protein